MTKWPHQQEAPAFFGRIETGDDGQPLERWEARTLTTIRPPFPMRLSWEPEKAAMKILCHRAVAADLTAILQEVFALYERDPAKVRKARMDLFGGCYNFRRSRGLHMLSMHAYGAAIDIDPERNPLGKKWEKDEGMMPLEVVAIFENHGWTWGGRWKGRPDPMHFQAASV